MFLGKKLAMDGCLRLSELVEVDVVLVEIGGIVVKDDEVVFKDFGSGAVKHDELTKLSTSGVFSLSLSTYSIR